MSTRQLAPDCSSTGADHNARDLGQMPASQLATLLDKLVALPAEKMLDADPHLVVTGRRGKFLVRPSRGKLRLSDADNPQRDPLDLAVAELPSYLDGSDTPGTTASPVSVDESIVPDRRHGLVAALLGLSFVALGSSAYFTFRPVAIDAEVEYSAVSAEQLSTLRPQLVGSFATGTGDGSRTLTLRGDGTLTLTETGPDQTIASELADTYQWFQRETMPVLRTKTLGPIEVRDAKTLFYAGEVYTRQP